MFLIWKEKDINPKINKKLNKFVDPIMRKLTLIYDFILSRIANKEYFFNNIKILKSSVEIQPISIKGY